MGFLDSLMRATNLLPSLLSNTYRNYIDNLATARGTRLPPSRDTYTGNIIHMMTFNKYLIRFVGGYELCTGCSLNAATGLRVYILYIFTYTYRRVHTHTHAHTHSVPMSCLKWCSPSAVPICPHIGHACILADFPPAAALPHKELCLYSPAAS